MRENAAAKARRLLTEGRVTIREADHNRTVAFVRGDTAQIYGVVWARSAGWSCTCPALGTRCSHIAAVQLVTVTNEVAP